MDIKEILSGSDIEEKISKLKNGRNKPLPDVDKIDKQIDPNEHDVMDPSKRPDKPIEDDNGAPTTVPVVRTPLSIQDLIVQRTAGFVFGNDVKLKTSDEDPKVKDVMKVIGQFNKDNRTNDINRQVARTLFTYTEVAEYWYSTKLPEKHNKYGFPSDIKLKCKVFSPGNGDELYPYFNEYGDLIAFSRAFKVVSGDETTEFFETWTDENYYRWKKSENDWEVDVPNFPLKIKKIPIVYTSIQHPVWYKVQKLIERLETILSNLGDTNDYFSSPILLLIGDVEVTAKKGEQGKMLMAKNSGMDGDKADAKYVSWDESSASNELEIKNLRGDIYAGAQMLDFSLESVKGIGNAASGAGLELLFIDPHIKMKNIMEVLGPYLDRRSNIQLAFVSQLQPSLKETALDMDIDSVATPYLVGSDTDKIENLVSLVSAGIISKQTATALCPYIENPEEEVERIKKELESAESLDEQQNEDIDV